MGAVLACGLATVDVVQVVAAPPLPDEKVVALASTVAAGGPACNAAMTAALLGVETRFVGAVGSGPLSAVVLRDLATHGVAVTDLAPAAFEPPLSTVLVTEATGERAVVSRNAVGTADYRALADRDLDALLEGVTAVLVDGHHLPVALGVARGARERGVPVLLDGGSWKPGLEELIADVDIAVVSAAFSQPGGGGFETLLDAGPGWVACSDGAGPVRWSAADGRGGQVDVPVMDVVDTLGAGDVLHGALLAEVARDGTADLPGMLAAAVGVASRSVGASGARGWAEQH
ncbi:carbohydrate kinase [Phycicoccus sp. CSK15P-2]|uniref:PfkB family carbohydrate kinase n=1 Tax=Phycicoccus sp. CSK15P-2 TaxID=2807627 RepID=UPI001951DC12|nr:PfkB family carbohydrate kinase [Phycicoccus sp. CSK15P-2]MBM6403596.1 carbohydrate kinase [Phycicoccus sp. CSK15P-2]MBM6405061.1 carbohydrate kinase [Phycicoccus sp. CSK15P-2]